jgi:hypothetical protein
VSTPSEKPVLPPGKPFKQLALCRACHQFVHESEMDCPHCGADIAQAAVLYQMELIEARRIAADLERLLRNLGVEPNLPGGSLLE